MYGLIINALAKADRIDDAMFVFRTMILNGGSLLPADITVLITACGNSAADEPLQRLYDFATEADRALLDDVIVTNAFITAFSRCGRLDIAYSLFRAFPNPDEVTFNTMIGAFVKADKDTNAISVFRAMIGYGFPAEARMLSGLISCCATLHPVQMLYQYATNIDKAVLANASVVNAFIAAFGRVGRIDIAQHIFEQLVEPRPSTNNAMLSAFVKSRHIAEAMDLFGSLLNRHAPIYPQVLQALVRACGDYSALQPLHMLFVYAKQSGQASLDRPLLVSEFAIAYGRCSDLGSVRSVHEMARQRNLLGDPRVLSAIVSAYTQCGETMTAQSVLEDSCFGNDPDAFASFVTALGHPRRLVDLQRLWKFAEGRCTLLTPAVICAFVDSFARCSCLTSVQLVHQVACDSGMVLADPAILSCITSAFERIGQSST
ncbi:Pentacotripeptide-repeat region of PRORP domain-containing protein [Plasmodiophora brassicae]|uniref:Pentacotripeptide-repeat region of PRORP domain-containing protein n=1 Tax=Plasmodiophora brassicae TaxID=37360 RepID=A0A0G4IUC6_PLABS|nr:hypothetical protein PBRA_006853 [Plasmodiophora brassicae]